MNEMDKATQEKIERLQSYEQTAQNLVAQKQALQSQLVEVESAVTELGKTSRAYKIVGGIMIESPPAELLKEMQDKKDILNMRLGAMEKQEKQVREKMKGIQSEVAEALKK